MEDAMSADEKILEEIEASFAPLRCVAEFQDYRYRLGFAVSDQNREHVLEKSGILLRHMRGRQILADLLREARRYVQGLGDV
jgi:hypothetical protein